MAWRGPHAPVVAVLAGVLAVAASGCTGSGNGSGGVAKAAPTTAAATTVPAPTTTVAASPRTTVTLPTELGPGSAHVAGTVTGPDGLVPDATVRVERLVDDSAVAATTVQSGADGRWAVDSVNGGRYRLRAWKVPDLAQLTPVVAFVTVDDTKPIDLPVLRYPGNADPAANVVPNPPVVGQSAVVAVSVANGGVDPEGVLHTQGRPGVTVTLAVSANVAFTTKNPVVTDANGDARFQVLCNQPGPITATAAVDTTPPRPIPLPACVPA